MTSRKRHERGFTLLEVMIAMTLLGLLMVALFGGLRLGVRAWKTGDRHAEETTRVEAVHRFVRAQLSQAHRLPWIDEDGREHEAFEGGSQAVTFTTLLPEHLAMDGFHLITLGLAGRGGERLVVSWRPFRSDMSTIADELGVQETTLADGVLDVQFSYFGRTKKDGPRGWHERWDDSVGLPSLVRMRVGLTDGRRWPVLVVAPAMHNARDIDVVPLLPQTADGDAG